MLVGAQKQLAVGGASWSQEVEGYYQKETAHVGMRFFSLVRVRAHTGRTHQLRVQQAICDSH